MIALVLLLVSCAADAGGYGVAARTEAAAPAPAGKEVAIFASGCFWCSESDFEKAAGVLQVESGYIGGTVEHPRYEDVGAGRTGHTEAVRVVYDPGITSYTAMLDWYWTHVDPFDGKGQFCDRGSQYRPAIFPIDAAQRAAAESSKAAIGKRAPQPIAVTIEPTATFWVAESYHQDFYKTNPGRYSTYRAGCGRDRRIAEVNAMLAPGGAAVH